MHLALIILENVTIDTSLNRINLIIIWLSISPFFLYAQKKDLVTWMNLGFECKASPSFAILGRVEWRTTDNLGATDRLGLNIGGTYNLRPFLKVRAGYEVHYRNREDATWKFRQRYNLDGIVSAQLQRVKFSLRERFQHTFDRESNELCLRTQLKLAYDIPECKLKPYISVEMYNSLHTGEYFKVNRMRYQSGVTVPLSDCWKADMFYSYQWKENERKNIMGMACTYRF